MTAKNVIAYCQRCQCEIRHRRGRRGRWHCLGCGMENVRLRAPGKGRESLPPGFSIEAFRDGQLGLYMARALGNGKGYAWYIKGIFPCDAPRSEIVSRAWEVHEALITQ